MSYTPTNWATGDVITAEKLNNMESGIVGAGEVLVINVIFQGSNPETLDKKCVEIKNALVAGKTLLGRMSRTIDGVTTYVFLNVISFEFTSTDEGCTVAMLINNQQAYFEAATDNDYPTYSE